MELKELEEIMVNKKKEANKAQELANSLRVIAEVAKNNYISALEKLANAKH